MCSIISKNKKFSNRKTQFFLIIENFYIFIKYEYIKQEKFVYF